MQNATEEIDRLERAFEMVKKQLFNRLHVIARERLFHFPVDDEVEAAGKDSTNGVLQRQNQQPQESKM